MGTTFRFDLGDYPAIEAGLGVGDAIGIGTDADDGYTGDYDGPPQIALNDFGPYYSLSVAGQMTTPAYREIAQSLDTLEGSKTVILRMQSSSGPMAGRLELFRAIEDSTQQRLTVVTTEEAAGPAFVASCYADFVAVKPGRLVGAVVACGNSRVPTHRAAQITKSTIEASPQRKRLPGVRACMTCKAIALTTPNSTKETTMATSFDLTWASLHLIESGHVSPVQFTMFQPCNNHVSLVDSDDIPPGYRGVTSVTPGAEEHLCKGAKEHLCKGAKEHLCKGAETDLSQGAKEHPKEDT